jgi:YgiT-type zinc finger domain-containing protein
MNICPICNENHVLERTEENEVHYRHQSTKLPIEFSYCPDCGEVGNTEQLKRNQQRMVMWKAEIDNKLDKHGY